MGTLRGNMPTNVQNWLKEIKTTDKVLELGCGRGELINTINAKTYANDCSLLNYQQSEVNSPKTQLTLMDLSKERIQYPNDYFDYILIFDVLEHLESPLTCMNEVKRVLKPDGIIIYLYPEERFNSGIGFEEDQTKRKYEIDYHCYPYPGLFLYPYQRVFMNQLYFKIVDEFVEGYHVYWKMINIKDDKIRTNILTQVNQCDYKGYERYIDVVTPAKFLAIKTRTEK